VSDDNIVFGAIMYFSYFLLFARSVGEPTAGFNLSRETARNNELALLQLIYCYCRFFYKAYFCKSERRSQGKKQELPADKSPVSLEAVLQANKANNSCISVSGNVDSSEEEKKKEQ
jgi:hypothetical protein